MKIKLLCIFSLLLVFSCTQPSKENADTVNDITQLNPIKVRGITAPTSVEQIKSIIQKEKGPISIGGGRYSMGGQTATFKSLQIDMRKFNKIISFSESKREITVQAGIRWRDLIEFIDRYNLSVSVMQSYANFTVGGSLSVNVHGRYLGEGAIISSVKQIKVVLANGKLVIASPTLNKEIFIASIGGYGGIGVIVEATLALQTNDKIERIDTVLNIGDYAKYFQNRLKNQKDIVFHNGIIYPNTYEQVRAVSHIKTTKPLTIKDRIKPIDSQLFFNRLALDFVSGSNFGKWGRRVVIDPLFFSKHYVVWRNYEATFDVSELEPRSRKKETYVLQEYFIPVAQFNRFYPKMVNVFKAYDVNVLNVSIRHAVKDSLSIMSWAKTEVFSFVVYYKQGITLKERNKVNLWTKVLIDKALMLGGSYYLPYQIQATAQQFGVAYPNASLFFKLKQKYDPTYKFRNKLFDAYYPISATY